MNAILRKNFQSSIKTIFDYSDSEVDESVQDDYQQQHYTTLNKHENQLINTQQNYDEAINEDYMDYIENSWPTSKGNMIQRVQVGDSLTQEEILKLIKRTGSGLVEYVKNCHSEGMIFMMIDKLTLMMTHKQIAFMICNPLKKKMKDHTQQQQQY